MRRQKLNSLLFIGIILWLPLSSASAQVPQISTIPEGLSVQQGEELRRSKSALEDKWASLRSKVDQHNQRCRSVPANTPLANECRQAMAQLKNEIASYAADVRRFNTAVIIANQAAETQAVQKEQREFERSYEAWLKRHEQAVRQGAAQNKKWADEVLKAFEAGSVPDPAHRPKTMKDLRPGDIILVSPAAGKAGRVSRWIRAADEFISGVKSPASHALAYIGRDASGRALFLDQVPIEGSRIRGETEFRQLYETREMHVAAVAKVLTPKQGRRLLRASLEAWEQEKQHWGPGSEYGVLGKNLVCSEAALVGVGKATGVDYRQLTQKTRLKAIASIDITPADFFDKENLGKYFVISPLNPEGFK